MKIITKIAEWVIYRGIKLVWKDEIVDSDDKRMNTFKILLKKIPIPEIDLPKIQTVEGKFFIFLRDSYVKHLDDLRKRMSIQWQQQIEIRDFQERVPKVFDLMIALCEGDNFYRDRVMDLVLFLWKLHDEDQKLLGDDYAEKYIQKREEIGLALSKKHLEKLGLVNEEKKD